MANLDPPAISTPSRPRYSLNPKRSGTFTTAANSPNVAGFSPGGQVFEGYSYLSRSTSMSTSTRSRPKGLQGRTSEVATTPPQGNRSLSFSPSSPHTRLANVDLPSSPFSDTVGIPQRSTTTHRMPTSNSTPELHFITTHRARSFSETERLAEAVANLPHNPKSWLPSQVALYLTHVLGLVPRPVVEDVTAYVRSSRMSGRAFLRLSEKSLERQGLNLKWRKLMVEAGRKLRRDALRGRIWGYESGSLRWPKSAQDLEREEADEEDASQEEDQPEFEQDGVIRSSKATSMLTLKRMRDSRKVRGMIQAFQTSPEKEEFPSPNLPTDAIYGEGYVRGQAQQILSEAEHKKRSLHRPLRPRRSTADYCWLESSAEPKHEDIEALLASLTPEEANELAGELGISDLKDTGAVSRALQQRHCGEKDANLYERREASGESADEVMLMPTLARHSSADSTSAEGDSSVSECSGTESEAERGQDDEFGGHKPRYSVLDEDIIRAIMAGEDETVEPESGSPKGQLTRSHTTASILRPSRPYRASLYTDDELAGLNNDRLHIRTESSRELVEALAESEIHGPAQPDFGTARLRSAEEKALDATPIPGFQEASSPPSQEADHNRASEDEYIFTLPEQPAHSRRPVSRAGSTRFGGTGGGRKATFGSKRGKAVLSMLSNPDGQHNDLFASLPGATMLRQKSSATAEDEDGWGGTLGLSRHGSRKTLNSVFEAGSTAFPKRGLARVASEAEGEALHAKLDQLEQESKVEEVTVEVPADRYEEKPLFEGGEVEGMQRRPSVEQRLSSLFAGGENTEERDEGEQRVADVTDGNVVFEDDQARAEGRDAVAEVVEPVVEDEAVTSPVDEAAESPVESDPAPVVQLPSEGASDESVELLESATPAEAEEDATASPQPESTQRDTEVEEKEEATYEVIALPSADPTPTVPASPVAERAAQMLVPLTQFEPDPSGGSASIKKRSMVLVDRKRFESLARRMTDLEVQLSVFDRPPTCGASPASTVGTGLRGMFDDTQTPAGTETLDALLLAARQAEEPSASAQAQSSGWWKPSRWVSFLSSLNPYYAQSLPAPSAGEEDELSMSALLGRCESADENQLLSIGAIPAYMLGLGAGLGFVLVRDVFAKTLARP